MSQRRIIIIIVSIFILLLVGVYFGYRYLTQDGQLFGGDENGGGSNFPIFGGGLFGGGQDAGSGDRAEGVVPKLRHITVTPVAGAAMFTKDSKTIIRFVDRETGHVFETSSDSLSIERISNTTIPRVQEALFAPGGTSVIMRYLNESGIVKNFYGNLLETKSSLDGWFLENGIQNIAQKEDGGLFYLEKIGNSVDGIIAEHDGTKRKRVFSSPILDWTPLWSDQTLFLATKPSHGSMGYLYTLNTADGSLSKVLSGEGLLALPSPNGKHVLFSASANNETTLYVYERAAGSLATMPFRTLAEKCVWASGTRFYCASPFIVEPGVYPDEWHQGLVSFSDDLWSFYLDSQIESLVYDAEGENQNFDITDLHISADGATLLFTNKKDLSLWSLSLR